MKNDLFLFLGVLLSLVLLTACGSDQKTTGSAFNANFSDASSKSATSAMDAASSSSTGAASASKSATSSSTLSAPNKANALIVYFSWSGNTRKVAQTIQTATGADIFEITTVNNYSDDYDTVLDEAKTEQQDNARPEIADTIDNFDQYDVVFFGFPNWWGDMPMVMYSFLDQYDFSGKTIVPFVTSGGSGFSNTLDAIAKAEPSATLTEGLALSGSAVDSAGDQINQWLNTLGFEA